MVLYPGVGPKNLDVFCVEAGRWQQNGSGTEFKEYFSISSNTVRKAAVVNKDQSKVWEKVAETTDKNDATTSTSALTALKDASVFKTELKVYSSRFRDKFKNDKDVIGVIAVSGNKVIGCDMFATHEMFAGYFPDLLDSYATEAITTGAPVTITHDKVNAYLMKLIADENKQEAEVKKNGTMLLEKGKKMHISTFEE